MFFEDLEYKGKEIPRTILGYGPFMAELYFGHRSRLYLDDLYNNPQILYRYQESLIYQPLLYAARIVTEM